MTVKAVAAERYVPVTTGFYPCIPVAKERPRTIQRHGKSITFTPQKTRNFEKDFKVALLGGMKYPAVVPPHKTARFMARLLFKLPRKSRNDLDNMIKGISDSANGVVYRDDIQVDRIVAEKVYVDKGYGVWFEFSRIEAVECL